jgi:hypothetical protein
MSHAAGSPTSVTDRHRSIEVRLSNGDLRKKVTPADAEKILAAGLGKRAPRGHIVLVDRESVTLSPCAEDCTTVSTIAGRPETTQTRWPTFQHPWNKENNHHDSSKKETYE